MFRQGMATERIVVDANCPQVRKKRNRAPKPWVIAGSKTTPTFETREGRDVAHVGYELELVPDDPSKLTNSARKLYFRLDDMGSLLYFSSERDGKLVSSTGVPGYAVFPIGFMLNGFDLKQSDKQTQYKRAWQMTYEEWKEGQQLTCETDDARLFWSAVHAFMEKFKEGGRARKSRRIAKEPEAGSIQSTVSTPETEGTPDTPATDLHPESRVRYLPITVKLEGFN